MNPLILAQHDWTLSYQIESNFRYIISEQEAYGWKIDIEALDKLLNKLFIEIDSVRNEVLLTVGKRVIDGGEVSKPLKLNGEPSIALSNWYNKLDTRLFPLYSIVGPFSKVTFEEVNLESPKQRVELLQGLGWIPTEFNYKTDKHKRPILGEDGKKIILSPKLTEESVVDHPVGKLIVEYMMMSHRFKLLTGLKERMRPDNALGSGGITSGTNTGRMMHRGIVNIPSVDQPFGEEIRSIFSHREGYVLIGADLKSLENRLMGHYTFAYDNGEYAKRLEEEDSHQTTVELLSRLGVIIDRSTAKTLNYALGYGCQVGKVKEIIGCGDKEARKIFTAWWSDKASMQKLKEMIEKSLKQRGMLLDKSLVRDAWIKGLDGRKIYVRSTHSLINCLIQNAGSVVNKFITCHVYNKLKEEGINAMLVCNYHDEINLEVEKKDLTIERVTAIIKESVDKCNKYFKFNIPMEMDIKVGNNWAEIH